MTIRQATSAIVVLALVASACSGGAAPSTTVAVTSTSTLTSTVAPAPSTTVLLPELEGFATVVVAVNGEELVVALADRPDLRRRGLMGVTDLGGLDGMLFVFEGDVDGGFWMKDTSIRLDIVFFDAEGRFVDRLTMEPCLADPCPTYTPSGSYRYALEVPAGAVPAIGPGSSLDVAVFDAE